MKQVLFAIVVLFLTTLWSVTTLLVVLFRLVTDRKRALKKTARNSEAHYNYNYNIFYVFNMVNQPSVGTVYRTIIVAPLQVHYGLSRGGTRRETHESL